MKKSTLALAILSLLLLISCASKRPPTTVELIKAQEYTEAEKNLQGAVLNLRFDPERALLLGIVYQKTGRTPLAKRVYLDVLEQAPDTIMVNDLYPGFDQRPVGALAKYLIAQIDAKPKHSCKSTPKQSLGDMQTFGDTTFKSKNKAESKQSSRERVLKSGAPGKYYGAHLASYKRALNIEPAAAQYRQMFPNLFDNKQFRTRRLDFGKKGVFHRLIVGPYPTRQQAADVCKQVKTKQSFCAVVKF